MKHSRVKLLLLTSIIFSEGLRAATGSDEGDSSVEPGVSRPPSGRLGFSPPPGVEPLPIRGHRDRDPLTTSAPPSRAPSPTPSSTIHGLPSSPPWGSSHTQPLPVPVRDNRPPDGGSRETADDEGPFVVPASRPAPEALMPALRPNPSGTSPASLETPVAFFSSTDELRRLCGMGGEATVSYNLPFSPFLTVASAPPSRRVLHCWVGTQ